MNWEFDFLYMLQGWHTPVLDKIMVFVSTLGNAGILWIGLGLLFLIPKKYRRMGLQMLLAMAVTYIIGNLILKNLVARQRPCWIDPSVVLLMNSPKDFSFPSGHTMNGFTASLTMLFNDKKLGIPAFILAIVIAFSRMYNFMHFPTDILGGIVIGTTVAICVNILFVKKNWKNPELGK